MFALHQTLAPVERPEDGVRVDAQKRAELEALFAQRMGRKPSREELELSVTRWITDEVLFREALRLELPENDPELRDQLIARMRGLLQAASEPPAPRDDELSAYYAEHRADYRVPATVTFVEYFVPAGPHGEDTARALLRRLLQDEPVELMPVTHSQRSEAELSALYGAEFANKVRALPFNGFRLLRSTRGVHVVRLDAVSEALDPPLEEVKPRLLADLGSRRAQQSFEAQLKKLSERWQAQGAGVGP